jgi:hypothetical protein
MKRRILIVFIMLWPFYVVADYTDGFDAYNRGDYATAYEEWLPLAKLGSAIAQTNLGIMYLQRRVAQQGYKEAFKWFRLAAEQGYANAQYNLGVMYHKGAGVRQDYKEVFKWFRLAAEQGIAEAQNNLGNMYTKGQGVRQDYKEAVKWFRLAAEQGFSDAQNNLGFMYYKGEGVVRNYVLAYKWFNLAAAASHEVASSNRDIVAGRMTSDQIAEAQTMTASFRAKKSSPKTVGEPSYTTVNRETVREIQSNLAALGYNPGLVDGMPGKRTVAAVKEYQRFAGIQPDGILSSALLKILETVLARKPKPEQTTN